MVPENVFLQKWNSNTNDDIHERIKVLARMFRCSGSVIARRALDNKKIDKSVYDRVIADAIEAVSYTHLDIDFFDLQLEPGSTILMCSDGLSNMVEDAKIEEIIQNETDQLPEKGEKLLREANQNGGKDNIAVVLVEPFTNEVDKC